MQRSIQERLDSGQKTKRKRSKKTKSYADEVNMARAKTGDVIYLPGQPDKKVTVINPTTIGRKIEISWFDNNGDLRNETVDPKGFVKD